MEDNLVGIGDEVLVAKPIFWLGHSAEADREVRDFTVCAVLESDTAVFQYEMGSFKHYIIMHTYDVSTLDGRPVTGFRNHTVTVRHGRNAHLVINGREIGGVGFSFGSDKEQACKDILKALGVGDES